MSEKKFSPESSRGKQARYQLSHPSPYHVNFTNIYGTVYVRYFAEVERKKNGRNFVQLVADLAEVQGV
jgi:hypothetical protein